MRTISIEFEPTADTVMITADRHTAKLIELALTSYTAKDQEEEDWRKECVFNFKTSLDRWHQRHPLQPL